MEWKRNVTFFSTYYTVVGMIECSGVFIHVLLEGGKGPRKAYKLYTCENIKIVNPSKEYKKVLIS